MDMPPLRAEEALVKGIERKYPGVFANDAMLSQQASPRLKRDIVVAEEFEPSSQQREDDIEMSGIEVQESPAKKMDQMVERSVKRRKPHHVPYV